MSDESLTRAFLDSKGTIARIVGGFVDNPADVEDLVQEAYARSLVASRRRTITYPKAFIAKSARNLALNHIASARIKANMEGTVEGLPADERFGGRSLEDCVETERLFHAYCLAIEQLPVRCRKVFTLKQVYGFSQREIAQRLNISEKTVEYHVSKGLAQLRSGPPFFGHAEKNVSQSVNEPEER